jgi:lipoprotein-anchoring transpeptidase ErfK/SrfK
LSALRVFVRLASVAVVVLVGTGACAFGSRQAADAGGARPVAAQEASGANAAPGPGRKSSPPAKHPPAAEHPPARKKPPREARKPAGCPQGPHQRAVETYLARIGGYGHLTVDGRQSPADCAAIRKFQSRYGIQPAAGRAGPTTLDVARRIAGTDPRACKAGKATTICVNLGLQTIWAMKGGKVVVGPTVTRTGMAGFATPAGHFRIANRNIREWSDPYKVWLPYWQRFYAGMGLHETTTYIHNGGIGSHGCVNLLPADARAMWKLATVGTRVHLFGHRPGT